MALLAVVFISIGLLTLVVGYQSARPSPGRSAGAQSNGQVAPEPVPGSDESPTAESPLAPAATPNAEAGRESVASHPLPIPPRRRPFNAAPAIDVEDLLGQMTLRQKVGQLLLYGFVGGMVESAASVIQTYEPGGIVFVENATRPEQAARLTFAMQEVARRTGQGIPLILAIDHEGGFVQRLKEGVVWFPGNFVLGATWSPELAYLQGSVQGRELRALGFNMNLAPVLDVDDQIDNPIIGRYDRSLGEDPRAVATLGAAYVRGLQNAGVMATAKHYPGHGSTTVDSHVGLPVVGHDLDTLQRLELPPFKAAIQEGAASVMAGHLSFPPVDSIWPSSLSPTFIDGMLRAELHYDGIVMTDAMGMGAITQSYAAGSAAVQAILAGNDMVLVVGAPEQQRATYQSLIGAAQDGRISQERLDASVRRILRAKAAFGLFDEPLPRDPASVGTDEHKQVVQAVADGAIALIRDASGRIPVQLPPNSRILVIRPESIARTGAAPLIGAEVRRQRPDAYVTELVFSFAGDNTGTLARAFSEAQQADVVIVGTANAGPWQRELIAQLIELGADPIVVGFDGASEITRLPTVGTYLAAYRGYETLVRAAVRAIFGEIQPQGRLPFGVGDEFPAGYSYRNAAPSVPPRR